MTHLLVRWIGRRCLRWFYRERCFLGLDQIPRTGPVLLIGNHGNDLPDVVCGFLTTARPLRFLATISGATSAISRTVYRGLGVIPVMRIRDVRVMREQGGGHDGATMNADAFVLVAEALANGDIVGAFPEGGVHDSPILSHFRAGVAKMALQSSVVGVNNSLDIVPFGVQYDAPARLRSDVTVVVGAPIALAEWLETSKVVRDSDDRRAEAKLALALRDRMRTALLAVTRNSSTWDAAGMRDRLTACVSAVMTDASGDLRRTAAGVQLECARVAELVLGTPEAGTSTRCFDGLGDDEQRGLGAELWDEGRYFEQTAERLSSAVERAGGIGESPRDVARILDSAGMRGGAPEWPSRAMVVLATPIAAVGWLVHGMAFAKIWRDAQRLARDRTEIVAKTFVPGLYLILCAWVVAAVMVVVALIATSRPIWLAIPMVMLLPRFGDVAVWWRDAIRAWRLRRRVTRWPTNDRAALCATANALRVAWLSHLASTAVHSAANHLDHVAQRAMSEGASS